MSILTFSVFQSAEIFNLACLSFYFATTLMPSNAVKRANLPSSLLCFIAYLLGASTLHLPKGRFPVWIDAIRDMVFLNPLIVCVVFGLSFSYIRKCATERLESMSNKEEDKNAFHARVSTFLGSDEGFAICFSAVLVLQYAMAAVASVLFFGPFGLSLSSLQIFNVMQVTVHAVLFLAIPIMIMLWEIATSSKSHGLEMFYLFLCMLIPIGVAINALFDFKSTRARGNGLGAILLGIKVIVCFVRMAFCASSTLPFFHSIVPAKQSPIRRKGSFEF